MPIEARPWIELQVRTMVEDVWAEIEHVQGISQGKRTSFAVRSQFRILSSMLQAIDEHFNFLSEELSRFQEEVTYTDADPLNAENLPAVLSELGIGCAQREIDGMLKLLTSRGVERVGDLLRIASIDKIKHVKNMYPLGGGPRATELRSRGEPHAIIDVPDEDVAGRIVSHLSYLKRLGCTEGKSPEMKRPDLLRPSIGTGMSPVIERRRYRVNGKCAVFEVGFHRLDDRCDYVLNPHSGDLKLLLPSLPAYADGNEFVQVGNSPRHLNTRSMSCTAFARLAHA